MRSILIVGIVFYSIIAVTSFISSIFGCLGTCCAPVVSISNLQNSLLATEIVLKTHSGHFAKLFMGNGAKFQYVCRKGL